MPKLFFFCAPTKFAGVLSVLITLEKLVLTMASVPSQVNIQVLLSVHTPINGCQTPRLYPALSDAIFPPEETATGVLHVELKLGRKLA